MSGEPTLDKGNSGFFRGTLHAWRNGRLSRPQYAVTMIVLAAVAFPILILIAWGSLIAALASDRWFLVLGGLDLFARLILSLVALATIARRLRDIGVPVTGSVVIIFLIYLSIHALVPVLWEAVLGEPVDISGFPELLVVALALLLVVVPTDWKKPRPPKGF